MDRARVTATKSAADVREASLKPSPGRVGNTRPGDEKKILVPGTSVDLEHFIALTGLAQLGRRGPGASSALCVDMAYAASSNCDEPRTRVSLLRNVAQVLKLRLGEP